MSDNKKKAILSSAVLLFVLSLVNKGLGFIKSMTIASVFGATIQTDAYYVAEGLMQNALIPISEAVAVSFLPIYITIKEKNKEEAHKFTSRTITDIFLLALVLSGILYVVAPMLLKLMLPSYTADSYVRLLFSNPDLGHVFLHVQSAVAEFVECGEAVWIFIFYSHDEQPDPDSGSSADGTSVWPECHGDGGTVFLYCSVFVFADQESGLWMADISIWLAGFSNLEALPPGSTDFLWKCNLRVESTGG